VTYVVDGDTIKVRDTGGHDSTVRLIGVDTPETKKPGARAECGGAEATDLARELVDGKTVWLRLVR
jgi:micrococcal nuclease